MKKYIKIISPLLCGVMFCLLYLNADAQTVITFDFQTKKLVGNSYQQLQQLKSGDLYQIQINNINSSLYKISINKRDSSTTSALVMPTFASFGIDALGSLINSLTTGGLIGGPLLASKHQLSALAVQSNFKNMLSGNNFKADFDRNFPPPPRKRNTDQEIIAGIMFAYETVLKDNYKKLSTLKVQCDQLIIAYNKIIIQSQIEYPTAANALFFQPGLLNLDNLYTSFNGIRSNLNALNDDIDKAGFNYAQEIKPFIKVIKKDKDLVASDSKLKGADSLFNKTIAKALDVVSPDNILKFTSSIASAQNSVNRSYSTLPLQFSKDQTTLDLNISPRSDDPKLQSYSTSITFPFKQQEFWGVSTGFYIGSLYNGAYSTLKSVSSSADTTYKVVSEKPSKFEFGVNAMIRYGRKIRSSQDDLYWQTGFGPGVTVSDKVRARLFLGTGIAKGKKHKILFDIGIVAGYTDQLSVLYKENEDSGVPPGPLVVSHLHAGGYFSIGYLFN